MSSFMVVMLLITMLEGVFPALVRADSDLGSGSNFITSVKLEIKEGGTWSVVDAAYPVPQNTDVRLTYDWEISNTVTPDIVSSIHNGSFFTVDIPDNIKVPTANAGFEIFDEVNSTKIVDGKLYLDGTKPGQEMKIEFLGDIPSGYSSITGSAGFETKFEFKTVPTENPVKLSFPIAASASNTIEVKFGPDPSKIGNGADKSGKADKYNPDKITWTLNVNKTLDTVENAKVEDTFGAGYSYVNGSLKVYDLTVQTDGTTVQGSQIGYNPEDLELTTSPSGFKLNLGNISGARQIVYETRIDDKTLTRYDNTAAYSGTRVLRNNNRESVAIGEINASVIPNRGSLLVKQGELDRAYNPRSVTWSVYVNQGELDLSDARIVDPMPAGLNLNTGSIKVYPVDIDDVSGAATVSGTELPITPGALTATPGGFTLELGSIHEAYKITYTADIADETKTSFKNDVSLYLASVLRQTQSATVSISRGKLVEKKESTSVIDYSDKHIDWYIDFNTAQKDITAASITDTLAPGHSLSPSSIKVFNLNVSAGGSLTEGAEAAGGIVITADTAATPQSFTVNFGNVSGSAYRIKYRTDITDVNKNGGTGFKNTAELRDAGGVITPGGISGPVTSNPTIQNTVSKSSTAIDYANKTIHWTITVKPKKEAMKNLKITDTFITGGLQLKQESIVVKRGSIALATTQYAVSVIDGDVRKGFVIDFGSYDVEGSDYTIEYTTDFDRNWRAGGDGEGRDYKNKADSQWIEESLPDGSKQKTASVTATRTIRQEAANNGSKSGSLRRSDREIDWTIDVNYLSEPLPAGLVIADTLNGNQVLKEGTVRVYGYSLSASDGAVVQGAEVTTGFAISVEGDKKSFTITLNDMIDGTEDGAVTKPYRIKYTSSLTGQSQDTYTNRAEVLGKSYTGSVDYASSNAFLSKAAVKDGELFIDWTIDFNKSLSAIENATITDSLSAGHVYVTGPGKLEVKKVTGVDANLNVTGSIPVDGSEYDVNYGLDPVSGLQSFILKFKNLIASRYLIKYKTEITSTQNNVTLGNSAAVSGSAITISTQPGTATVAFSFSSLSAAAKAIQTQKMCALTVTKEDAANASVKLAGAVFQIVDKATGVPVGSYTTQGTGGTFTVSLKRGDYVLKETTPPSGYQPAADQDVTLDAATKDLTVKNHKLRSITVRKTDALSGTELNGAEFTVKKKENGAEVGTITTAGSGTGTLSSLPFGEYEITETKAPTDYMPDSAPHSITLNASSASNVTVDIANQPLRTLTITKLDAEDDSPLTGAAFRITGGPAGHEVDVTTGLTDSSGKATVSGLYFGNYIVSEVTTPGNYNPPVVNSFTVDLNSLSGLDSGLTVKNYKYGQITLHKKDAQDNTPLAGAVFAVIKEGTEVGTITTDGTGTGTLGNLPFGTYSIVERTAPAGYMLDTATTVDVTLSPGSTSGSETLTDYKLRNLTIKKVDGANNTTPLAGAKFRIEGPAGFTPVETAATDASGITTVSGLSFGTYQITEITAPPGYYLNTSPASITLDKTDDSGNPPLTYSLTMTNARIPSGGGGGGGGGTAPEPPKPPVVPPVEPPVQPGQPQQPEQPKPPEQKETTTENTPVDGNITVPEGEIPTVGQPPQNGKVEVDEKGNWTYTPDPGFKGKDNFTIKVKDQDGNDKEILIEVDVNEIPQGAAKTLPKTGEQGRLGFYGAGLLLILAGFLLWRRRMA